MAVKTRPGSNLISITMSEALNLLITKFVMIYLSNTRPWIGCVHFRYFYCTYCRLICTTPYFTTIAYSSSLISKDHFDTSFVVISKVFVKLSCRNGRIMVKIEFFYPEQKTLPPKLLRVLWPYSSISPFFLPTVANGTHPRQQRIILLVVSFT